MFGRRRRKINRQGGEGAAEVFANTFLDSASGILADDFVLGEEAAYSTAAEDEEEEEESPSTVRPKVRHPPAAIVKQREESSSSGCAAGASAVASGSVKSKNIKGDATRPTKIILGRMSRGSDKRISELPFVAAPDIDIAGEPKTPAVLQSRFRQIPIQRTQYPPFLNPPARRPTSFTTKLLEACCCGTFNSPAAGDSLPPYPGEEPCAPNGSRLVKDRGALATRQTPSSLVTVQPRSSQLSIVRSPSIGSDSMKQRAPSCQSGLFRQGRTPPPVNDDEDEEEEVLSRGFHEITDHTEEETQVKAPSRTKLSSGSSKPAFVPSLDLSSIRQGGGGGRRNLNGGGAHVPKLHLYGPGFKQSTIIDAPAAGAAAGAAANNHNHHHVVYLKQK